MRQSCLLLALAVACGDSGPPRFDQPGLVFVTDATELPAGCVPGPVQFNVEVPIFPGTAVEPAIAADPRDPQHFCAAFQQDRIANGGAAAVIASCSFDGGHTWKRTTLPFSACTGGSLARATDPWVSIGPDGTVHIIALGLDGFGPAKSMLAARSTDGGRTWSTPIALQADTSEQFFMDKETITADPNDARFVYAVWDRFNGDTNDPTTPAPNWFTRSIDGGLSWEPPRIIAQTGPSFQGIGNQIAVLPGGRLVNVFTFVDSVAVTFSLQAQVSDDHGGTWSDPIAITAERPTEVEDLKTQKFARTGDIVPAVAVDPATGALWVAWGDTSSEQLAAVALVRSDDGGVTWTQPLQLPEPAGVQAFTPAVSAEGGVVGVSYYDTRDDIGVPTGLRVARWLATSDDLGQTFTEARLSEGFDIETAPNDEGFFLGDYMGLVHAGNVFTPIFVVTSPDHRTDVVFRPADSPPDKALRATPARERAPAQVARIFRSAAWPVLGR
ncbi:MAG TPA: sialidase family protein [Myxococcales bacterium]|jgi:hypothetical protein